MKDGHMVIANAGDCRAVLSRAGKAEALTSDHRAGREDERERIESLVSCELVYSV
jgi:protein phosphatase 1L